ncbi:MAG: lipid A biosynthesis acyltransferase [Pseudomonadota bacterium]
MAHWSDQRDRGNLFWISVLSWIATHLGRGFLRAICLPIALFFLVTASAPRTASKQYLSKVMDTPPTLWHVFRHFYTFALVSADRVLFLTGKTDRFDLRFSGHEIVRRHAMDRRGCIMLVSHLGSFDAMRMPAFNEIALTVRILIDKSHNPAAMQVIDALNPEMAKAAIDAGVDSTQLVLSVGEACRAGDMVGIMADRAGQEERLQQLDFLGESAGFPSGPWVIALVLKAPVILCFATYAGGNRYDISFRELYDGSAVPRPDRHKMLEENMAKYVTELERMARSYPYNWFNFYDFWLDNPTQ